MALGKEDQAAKMAAELARRRSDPFAVAEADTRAQRHKTRLAVYLAPAVAQALEAAYHAERLAGGKVSRSELVERALRALLGLEED